MLEQLGKASDEKSVKERTDDGAPADALENAEAEEKEAHCHADNHAQAIVGGLYLVYI